MKLLLVKTIHGLQAAYQDDKDKLQGLRLGETYKATIVQPRNLQFHKKYFCLLGLVFDNLPEHLQDSIRSVDELHTELKMQTGVRMKRQSLGGQSYYVPGSIAFAKMTEDEFSEFYSRAVDCIVKFILPGVDRADIMQEVESFL